MCESNVVAVEAGGSDSALAGPGRKTLAVCGGLNRTGYGKACEH